MLGGSTYGAFGFLWVHMIEIVNTSQICGQSKDGQVVEFASIPKKSIH